MSSDTVANPLSKSVRKLLTLVEGGMDIDRAYNVCKAHYSEDISQYVDVVKATQAGFGEL